MKTSFKEQYFYTVKADIRKYHYWRGFRTALIITTPIILFLSVTAYILINALIK